MSIWYYWVHDKWGRDLNKMRREARKYWINKWEGCKNIEYLKVVMGKINRTQCSWRVLSSSRKGGPRTCGFRKFFYFRLAKEVLKYIPHFKYIVKIENDFDQSWYGLPCY